MHEDGTPSRNHEFANLPKIVPKSTSKSSENRDEILGPERRRRFNRELVPMDKIWQCLQQRDETLSHNFAALYSPLPASEARKAYQVLLDPQKIDA